MQLVDISIPLRMLCIIAAGDGVVLHSLVLQVWQMCSILAATQQSCKGSNLRFKSVGSRGWLGFGPLGIGHGHKCLL
jgi:hypothetical protein